MASSIVTRRPAASSPSASLDAPMGRFTADGFDRAPLPDLPAALPCPFCGRTEDIMISQTEDSSAEEPWYRANCGNCGVDAPGQDSLMGAAQEWNKRPAGSPASAAPAAGQQAIDVDAASSRLQQAKAVLELLHGACESVPLELPDHACGTLSDSLLAAIRLVDEVKALVYGKAPQTLTRASS